MTENLHSILEDCQIGLEYIDLDADDETVYGSGVDMLSRQGVIFMAALAKGTAATLTLKAQQDSASNFGTVADLEGTSVTDARGASADAFCAVEVKNPLERYVRPAVIVPDIGTATAVCIMSIAYGLDRKPETNSDGELHTSPAEGTA